MTDRGPRRGLTHDERGATATEFAIIAPAFLATLFGAIHLGLLALTAASLTYAAEKGARCGSLAQGCKASDYYFAPGPAPTFTYAAKDCGTSLVATVAYDLNVFVYQASIPLSASACFP